MQNSKLKSGLKKINTLSKVGIDPFIEGKKNFDNPIIEIETLAQARALTCLSCDKFQKEPIEFLRVVDIRIPELSEMFCDDCGCTSSYKLRQSISKCKLWQQ
jgi:hypothetical protein